MTNNKLTNVRMTTITREQQKQILIDTANHVISRDNTSPYSENLRELARIALASLTAEPAAPQELRKGVADKDLLGVIGALDHPAGINAAAKRVVRQALVELQERRKFDQAKLINKFYERYPLETFRSDSERAEALGYYMAGAELQRCGEFIVYKDDNCDE